LAEHDGYLAEHDGYLAEHDGYLAERDGYLTEYEGYLAEHDGYLAEQGDGFGISGLRGGANKICDLLGFHAAWNGCFFPTFRDNLSAQSSKIEHFKKNGLFDLRRWDI
jgi:hypothetical protein